MAKLTEEKPIIVEDGCGGLAKFLEEERRRQWEKERANLKAQRAANENSY